MGNRPDLKSATFPHNGTRLYFVLVTSSVLHEIQQALS